MGLQKFDSEKKPARFEQEKAEMKALVNDHLSDLKDEVNVDKVLKVFDEDEGGKSKMLVNVQNGRRVLKEKGGTEGKEKIKITKGGKFLVVKDKQAREVLKVNLREDKVIKNHGFEVSNVIETKEEEKKDPCDKKGAEKKTVVDKKETKEEKEIAKEPEKKELDLSALKEAVEAIEEPRLGTIDGSTEHNLKDVQTQIDNAENFYAEALAAATAMGIANSPELKVLRDKIDRRKSELEQQNKLAKEKEKTLDEDIDKLVEQVLEEQKADEVARQKMIDKMTKEAAEAEANLAKTAEESFELIQSGNLDIKETNFDGENLNTVGGVRHEMKKHNLAMENYQSELRLMNQGMVAMENKFAEFEDKKANWNVGKVLGGAAAATAGASGVAVLLGATAASAGVVAAAPAILIAAGVVAAGAATYKLGQRFFGKWQRRNQEKNGTEAPTALQNSSFLGMFDGSNEAARIAQQDKVDFEKRYDDYSDELQIKGETLRGEGEDIYKASEDPQGLSDTQGLSASQEGKFRGNLENLYKSIGLEVDTDLIEAKIEDLKEDIDAANQAEIVKLQDELSPSRDFDNAFFAQKPVENLEYMENSLDALNFQASDIGDYTFGFLGKNLQKMGDWPVVGGVANSVGKMSEGIGGIISNPDKFANGIAGLVGFDFSPIGRGDRWSWNRMGNTWKAMGAGLIAKESWKEADSFGDYWNATTETGFNFLTLLATFGGGAAARAGQMGKLTATTRIGRLGQRIRIQTLAGGENLSKIITVPTKGSYHLLTDKAARSSAYESAKGLANSVKDNSGKIWGYGSDKLKILKPKKGPFTRLKDWWKGSADEVASVTDDIATNSSKKSIWNRFKDKMTWKKSKDIVKLEKGKSITIAGKTLKADDLIQVTKNGVDEMYEVLRVNEKSVILKFGETQKTYKLAELNSLLKDGKLITTAT